MPEQAVLRVDRGGAGVLGGPLPVGGAVEDEPVQPLDAPAPGDEPAGEPFEQFRMARGIAAEPEIARRPHQTLAEVVLPDPVDHHPRREAACAAVDVGHPERQRRALEGRLRRQVFVRSTCEGQVIVGGPAAEEDGQDADRDPFLAAQRVAAVEEPGRGGGRRGVDQGERPVFRRAGRRGEGGDEPVIVARRDRVVFMVVTAGTPDRQAEHRGAGRTHDVVQLVIAVAAHLLFELRVGEDDRPDREEPGRRAVLAGRPKGLHRPRAAGGGRHRRVNPR